MYLYRTVWLLLTGQSCYSNKVRRSVLVLVSHLLPLKLHRLYKHPLARGGLVWRDEISVKFEQGYLIEVIGHTPTTSSTTQHAGPSCGCGANSSLQGDAALQMAPKGKATGTVFSGSVHLVLPLE